MLCLGLLGVIAIGIDSGPCMAQPFAYVTNNQSLTVSVIDTATNTVVATVPVGFGPVGVAVAPNGSRVYVANGGSGVAVIDTATNTVVVDVALIGFAQRVAVVPNGTRAYVPTFPSSVSVIDTATNTLIATIPGMDSPQDVAVTPDGTRAYVTQSGDTNSVAVIDTATNTVVATLPVGILPARVAIIPAQSIASVIAQVGGLNINSGEKKSLTATLRAARESLVRGDAVTASNQLHAFINHLRALERSGRLDPTTASSLVDAAQAVIDAN